MNILFYLHWKYGHHEDGCALEVLSCWFELIGIAKEISQNKGALQESNLNLYPILKKTIKNPINNNMFIVSSNVTSFFSRIN